LTDGQVRVREPGDLPGGDQRQRLESLVQGPVAAGQHTNACEYLMKQVFLTNICPDLEREQAIA
jgi:hypothetical protein